MVQKKVSTKDISVSSSIDPQFKIKEFKWTEKQKEFFKLIQKDSTRIVLIDGPAGSAKTLVSIYSALKALQEEKVEQVLYIRSIIESASRSLGSLPGQSEEKFEPFTMPLRDKLDELVSRDMADKLIEDEFVKAIPINYLRGSDWRNAFLCSDENQNMTLQEIKTLMTRIGKNSKMILCADSDQSDLNGKSGFKKIFDLFNDQESFDNGIRTFQFDYQDIMRSKVAQFIVRKLTELNK